METRIQYIELINDYLNNQLSAESKSNFETTLQNDITLKTIYDEHLIFLGGLNRTIIREDIQKAKQSYHYEKWMKTLSISIVIIGAIVMLYTLVFNRSGSKPIPNSEIENTLIIDSTLINTTAVKSEADSLILNDKTKNKTAVNSSISTAKHITKGNYKPFKKQHQVFEINTQNDTTITCKEGTVLNISKGSFINPKIGKPITGKVDLKVIEYYKLSDILLANLSTTSNGKQLETGGMLHMEAIQNDINLVLKADKTIDISFPTQTKKPGMQLFSGEWNNEIINWNLENIEEFEQLDLSEDVLIESIDDLILTDEVLEDNIHVPYNLVEQVPLFPGCENKNEAIRKQCTNDAISKFINRNFNTDIGAMLNLSGTQRINCIFTIDQQGKIVSIRTRAPHPRLSEEAERVINLLPQMTPGRQRGKTVAVPYSLPIIFSIEGQTVNERFGSIISRDSSMMTIAEQMANGIEMDTVYTSTRGIIETIREVMHDKDFLVDSSFITAWNQYKKQKLIRRSNQGNSIQYILRKPLFEMENTRFKILKDDSITRGGHIIRIPWDEGNVPSSITMNFVPKRKFTAGTDIISAKEFEARLDDTNDTSISSSDATYYALKSSNLGWINCDRFTYQNSRRIQYQLTIKNADGAKISMVFKSYNSILPSRNSNDIYDFKTIGAGEEVVLVAIKRKAGKLFYDMIETTTEEHPKLNFEFKEVTIQTLQKELNKLNE